MSKGKREAKKKKTLEQRANSPNGVRSNIYKEMARKGVLGHKDMQKYREMYAEVIAEFPELRIIAPDNYDGRLPTRTDYNVVRKHYDSL